MKNILFFFCFGIKILTANSQTNIYDYEYLAFCDSDSVNFYRLTLSKPDVDSIIYVKQFIPTTYGFLDYIPTGTITAGGCSSGGAGAACCEDAESVGVGGVAVYHGQSGLTFQFRSINAGNGTIEVSYDTANFEIDLSVNIDSLIGIEISQIDSLYTYLNLKQTGIQYQDEGVDKGTKGGLDTFNVVGVGLTGTNSGGKFTLTHDPNIESLNGLDTIAQTMITGESGSNFNINSSGSVHTFNLPIADETVTGKLSSSDWNTFFGKADTATLISTTLPIQGGGSIGINRTHSLANGDYGDIDAASNWQAITLDTNSVKTVTVQDSAIQFSKIQSIPKNRLLGRKNSSYGNLEPLVVGNNLTLSNDTLHASITGGMGSYYQYARDEGVDQTQRGKLNFVQSTTINPTLSDDSGNDETEVSLSVRSLSISSTFLQDSAVTFTKFKSIPASRLIGNDASGYGNVMAIVPGSNLTFSNDTLNVSGISTYTDEQAQDAVGAMINSSLQYVDGTPLLAINDRDNGDITTSASGLTWNIDAGVIGSTELADSSVTAAKIISNAVTSTALATDAVTNLKVANNAIDSTNITASNVTTTDILDATVQTSDLKDSAVSEVKLISNSVGTTALKSSAVTSLKISDGTIATADLADSLITTAKLLSNSVGTTALASNSVSLLKMADNSVDSTNIVADGVTMSKLDQGGATSGQVITWNGSDWRPATPVGADFDINNKFEYFCDFTDLFGSSGLNGLMHVTVGGTGANHGAVATLSTYGLGEAELTTGTQSNGYAGLYTRQPTLFFSYGAWVFKYNHWVSALSDATDRYQTLIGFFDTESVVNQVDGAYFLYDEGGVSTGSAASANWQCVTVNNSTRTFTTTGTAVTATSYQKLEIQVNAAGTSIDFIINGSTVATHTTNIPTTSARATGFGTLIKKSAGTNARLSRQDYLYVKCNLTNAR